MGLTFKEYRFRVDINAVVKLASRLGITLKKDATDDDCIQQIVDKRNELRSRREWVDADGIRAELANLGIVQEDTGRGTIWRYNRSRGSQAE